MRARAGAAAAGRRGAGRPDRAAGAAAAGGGGGGGGCCVKGRKYGCTEEEEEIAYLRACDQLQISGIGAVAGVKLRGNRARARAVGAEAGRAASWLSARDHGQWREERCVGGEEEMGVEKRGDLGRRRRLGGPYICRPPRRGSRRSRALKLCFVGCAWLPRPPGDLGGLTRPEPADPPLCVG